MAGGTYRNMKPEKITIDSPARQCRMQTEFTAVDEYLPTIQNVEDEPMETGRGLLTDRYDVDLE